ncbi:MAG: cysteine hydrolase [Paramuribaculum sp.]|nr:cysteine hydrolase [Paramuribaculum sp.]MDE6303997.1 cysteine hydrolase [Paramuribaculum sp.]
MENKIGGMLTHADNAILVIDMQKEWLAPDATFRNDNAVATIPAIKKFLDWGRANDWAIIYVYRVQRISGIDADMFRRHFFEDGKPYCLPGSVGAEMPDEIAPQSGDIQIHKQRFDCFMGTDLEIVLRGLGVKNIYITGTQYPNCIRTTAVASMERNYPTTVLTDCCSALTEEVANANIYDLKNMGISCITSIDVMQSANNE